MKKVTVFSAFFFLWGKYKKGNKKTQPKLCYMPAAAFIKPSRARCAG